MYLMLMLGGGMMILCLRVMGLLIWFVWRWFDTFVRSGWLYWQLFGAVLGFAFLNNWLFVC